jgi:ribose transport system substrate-binding protein
VKGLTLAGLLCTAAATVAAGCGGSDDGSASGGRAAAGSGCSSEAQKLVQDYRKPIPLKGPPGDVDMSGAKGKTFWIVSIDNTPFVQQGTDGFKAAAAAVGGTGKFFDAKGNISLANQALATAIDQKAGGIALWAIDPKNVAGQLKKAQAAGIPVIDVNASKPDAQPAPGVFGHVTSDWTQVGKMFADYMLAQTKCDLDAQIFSIKSIPIFVDAEKGTQAEIARLCPDCKTHVGYINLATVATSLAPQAQTALTRDPNINYMTPIADVFSSLIEPGIRQAGKDVPLISHDGAEPALKAIRSGQSLQKATVSTPPPPYYGWAFMDQLGRAIAGQDAAVWALPNQIIDSTNIGKSDAELFPKYDGFEDAFKKSWGVSG